MEIEYKHDGPVCEGVIKFNPITFDQRYQYIEECSFKTDDKGEVVMGIEHLHSVRKMVSVSQKHYKFVEIKNKNTGAVHKSFEDLTLDPECDEVLIGAAGKLINGGRVSKK